MASDLTGYLGNKILRWIDGTAMPTAPTAVYVGLHNGNPKTSGVEVTTTIDATGRKACGFATLASGVDHLLTSDADVDFGLADAGASVSHYSLWDAASSGNMLASRAVSGGPIAVAVGAAVKFLAGAITFNIGSDS
jgi:hypothetical protein